MALTAKSNFIIDGVEFRTKSLKVNFESLASEDSGRTDDGTMNINWVLSRIRKIEIEMPPCTTEEAARILDKVHGRIYNITYFDPLANRELTKEVYTSNSSADCYSGVLRNGLWQGISFNAIERAGEV